jgi:hypothetical protein
MCASLLIEVSQFVLSHEANTAEPRRKAIAEAVDGGVSTAKYVLLIGLQNICR